MANGDRFFDALRGATHAEVKPLAQILDVKVSGRSDQFAGDSLKEKLWEELSYCGSNDIAFIARGGDGVDYDRILRDVCKKKGVNQIRDGNGRSAIESNERRLLKKLFEEIWEHMTDEERLILLQSMDLDEGYLRKGGAAAAAAIFAGEMSGFLAYRGAVILANFVSRALLGAGLTLAGNAALTRALGAVLGPVGWIASGAWLIWDLAGPAYRKTVPAIVQVAALRQLNERRRVIGVVGRGSVGKDSLIKHVFGIDTGGIDPIPGSTSEAQAFSLADAPRIRVLNFPGFGDLDPKVESTVWDQIRNASVLIYMIDEIPQAEEVERFFKVRNTNPNLEVVLNKCDKLDSDELELCLRRTIQILKLDSAPICCSLKKPNDRFFKSGVPDIRRRMNLWASEKWKEPMLFPDVTSAQPDYAQIA